MVDAAQTATDDAGTAAQRVQSTAKLKHKMLAEDVDPTTNFLTDAYLIGTRLNANRGFLLHSAVSLFARLDADSLPGFKAVEQIQAVMDLLTPFTAARKTPAGCT